MEIGRGNDKQADPSEDNVNTDSYTDTVFVSRKR